ncbi:hypothetical protein [Argonema antarcticum]|uniref:hypothetical protein n=1 Tax=Argonema antarcticum TaxID=2942763 RepID=UPI002013125E|nr:hypothetical protein [Argonema antarcticum]MCL1473162.1 hypothetical protein [Argonema antarcticum A004/B2]
MALELAAAKIAEIAFGKLVETAVGKSIEAGLEKLKPLRDKILHKLTGNADAEAALAEVQQNPFPANVERVATFLDAAMRTDKPFANEVQTLAQQINQEINVSQQEDTNLTQNNINSPKSIQAKAESIGQIGDVINNNH